MKILKELPEFKKNKQFAQLKHQDWLAVYRFTTLEYIRFESKYPLLSSPKTLNFYDKNGKKWLVIDQFSITITKNYAWDGCTPKIHIKGLWIGTPDFDETILASLLHDVLLQFRKHEGFPFSRALIDDLFEDVLRGKEFKLRVVYSGFVKTWSFLTKFS